jgi:hypothetical protein
MSTPAKILDTLAKLIKHQESAAAIGNIEEAAAFGDKVQELLTKHKLEMSDVQFKEQAAAEPIKDEYISPQTLGIKREPKRILWQEMLATAVAHSNDCQLLITNKGNAVWFVGRKTDREICARVHSYFVTLVDEMAEGARYDAAADEKQRTGLKGADLQHHMRMYQQSFCTGAADAISSRLYARRREMEKAAEAQAEQSTALVHLRKTHEEVSQFITDMFKDKKPRKAKDNMDCRNRNLGAYEAGYEKGEQVALTSGAIGNGEN